MSIHVKQNLKNVPSSLEPAILFFITISPFLSIVLTLITFLSLSSVMTITKVLSPAVIHQFLPLYVPGNFLSSPSSFSVPSYVRFPFLHLAPLYVSLPPGSLLYENRVPSNHLICLALLSKGKELF